MTEPEILDLFRTIIKAHREDFGPEYYEKILDDPRKIHGLMASSLIDGLAETKCTDYYIWRYLTDICLQDEHWAKRHEIKDWTLSPTIGYMWPEEAHKFGYQLADDPNCFIKQTEENIFNLIIENGQGLLSCKDNSHKLSGWHVLPLWENLLEQGITE